MVSINTNLSSILCQRNLLTSTNGLNKAIERLSTGFKINDASDNAANFSISTNMTTKISAYMVAEENTSMGMDLVSTANDNLELVNTHLERIRDLCEQAANGTYGEDSRKAIQSEIDARESEISRVLSTTEYNGIKLLDKVSDVLKEKGLDTIAQLNPTYNGFISDPVTYTDAEVAAMTSVSSVTGNYSSGTSYKISSAEELAKLATDVNNGKSTSGATFVLASDIDLSAYQSGTGWTPMGTYYLYFNGTFDGNGHKVSNLKINNPTEDSQGLFGYVSGIIQNIGIENCEVNGKNVVGDLAGVGYKITNCYATGNVSGTSYVGGLVGEGTMAITNSYATGDVSGTKFDVGGLVGHTSTSFTITNSYATGNVSGTGTCVGGLVGCANNNSTVTNSYATGNVSGKSQVGGLAGTSYGDITNSVSFAEKVSGSTVVGSFAGYIGTGTEDSSCMKIIGLNNVGSSYDTNISYLDFSTTLQVGINSDDSSQITFNTDLYLGSISIDVSTTEGAKRGLDKVDSILAKVSSKQTSLGAVSNRLDSALDSISVSYDNLVSSRSTLRDADVAEESSEYIKMQILQQASATLLATANQSPSIALQLI